MKILLVDDHILFAKSLSIALCDNPEIEQFSSTKDIQDLEKQIATELPDILLIDINLGGLADEDGLMLTQHLLERFPDQKIAIPAGSPTGCLAPTVPDQSHPPPAAPTRHAGAVLPPWPAGSLGGRGAGCARWVESTGRPAQRGYGVLPWFSPHNLATSYDGMSGSMQRFPQMQTVDQMQKRHECENTRAFDFKMWTVLRQRVKLTPQPPSCSSGRCRRWP